MLRAYADVKFCESWQVLHIDRVVKDFGKLRALNGVTLSVGQGQIVGLIGPNGSGKTTLLKCIVGLLKPERGRIYLRGRDVTGAPPWERIRIGLGFTNQIPRAFKEFSVFENLLYASHSRGGGRNSKEKVLAERALKLVGLQHKSMLYPSELSYGDLKCLEIGRLLAVGSRVWLLDEPFAGLSIEESERLIGLIKALRKENAFDAVMIVEHKLSLLLELIDFSYVLNYGNVIAAGEPKDVLRSKSVQEAYIGTFDGDE